MSITPLTTGALAEILNGDSSSISDPVFQVLGSKRIASGGGVERFRLLLSDGKYLQSFAMLATQLNERVSELTDLSIIRVKQHATSVVSKADKNAKRVLIIMDLDLLHSGAEVGKKIGDPVNVENAHLAEKSEATKPASATSSRPAAASAAASALNESIIDGRVTHPISSLSPYQNKWVIKVRVTSKSAVRTWSNAKGEGKLFSMDLMDESGEIRATAFRDAVDKYYDMIEVDKVYFISKCQLKPANKQFTTIKNDYEMTFNNDTVVQECTEPADNVPTVQYNFVTIAEIAEKQPNDVLDVIGVCKEFGDLATFTARSSGRELKKRELTLVDNSNASIGLTLWGADAENFNDYGQPVLLVKNARVTEFNGGKSISLGNGSVMKSNPDCVEGHRLRGWFDNGGGESIQTNVSGRTGAGSSFTTEWLTFHDAKVRNLGNGDKPDYFQVKSVVHIVRSNNAIYKACPQAECNKKVIDMENGQYRCEKCCNEYPNFKYRLMVNMSIGDWTSNRWVTCFSDVAEQMFGKTSQEVGEAYERSKEEGDAILTSIHFKSFVFKLRSKVETFSDTSRNKLSAQSVSKVNHKEYNQYLIKNIQELTGVGKH